jgi:hypothetical protein
MVFGRVLSDNYLEIYCQQSRTYARSRLLSLKVDSDEVRLTGQAGTVPGLFAGRFMNRIANDFGYV